MLLQRPSDLCAEFTADGRILLRSETMGIGAKVPPFIVAILAECHTPKTRAQVLQMLARFAPQPNLSALEMMLNQLIDANMLCDPQSATAHHMFRSFADINVQRRMLADTVRMTTYKRAIERYVKPGMVVIDAGAGTGVLAIFAAKAGARKVYAIEHSDLAERITLLAKENGVESQIEVVQANFSTVQLPEKADVLITETFGAWALAEGAAPELKRCIESNLKNNGKCLPEKVSLYLGAFDETPKELVSPFLDRVDGLKLNSLLRSATHRSLNSLLDSRVILHSEQRIITLSLTENAGEANLHLNRSANGLALWFILHFNQQLTLPTGPSDPPTHWKQTLIGAQLPAGNHRIKFGPNPDDSRGILCQFSQGIQTNTASTDGHLGSFSIR